MGKQEEEKRKTKSGAKTETTGDKTSIALREHGRKKDGMWRIHASPEKDSEKDPEK